jgi:hypothetical protein
MQPCEGVGNFLGQEKGEKVHAVMYRPMQLLFRLNRELIVLDCMDQLESKSFDW